MEVEKDSEIIITEDNKKGEYNFKVKNYNDLEEVSQVDLKYYIEILEEDLDKSIKYELYVVPCGRGMSWSKIFLPKSSTPQ